MLQKRIDLVHVCPATQQDPVPPHFEQVLLPVMLHFLHPITPDPLHGLQVAIPFLQQHCLVKLFPPEPTLVTAPAPLHFRQV